MPCPWLDGKHVVFGKVVEGMATVKRMEVVGSRAGKTSRKVQIADSGQVCPPILNDFSYMCFTAWTHYRMGILRRRMDRI